MPSPRVHRRYVRNEPLPPPVAEDAVYRDPNGVPRESSVVYPDSTVVYREQTATYRDPDVVEERPAAYERRVATATINPARVVTALGGGVFLVIGLISMARAGLSTPLDQPVVNVAGMTHTALLGIIGAAFGIVLLLAAFLGSDEGSRNASMFFGSLIAIAGIVGIATPHSFKSLALQSSYGWMTLIIGLVVVIANLLLPAVTTSRVSRVASYR